MDPELKQPIFAGEVEVDRLAETDYALPADPTVCVTRFGRFSCDPRFPKKNSLTDCRCSTSDVDRLLAELAVRHIGKITGHDPETYDVLLPVLEKHGWKAGGLIIMQFLEEPQRPVSREVRIEVVDPRILEHSASYLRLFLEDLFSPEEVANALSAWEYHCATEWKWGGEVLVGWLDDKPAGRCGWFVVNGVARFRTVVTSTWARRRGVASTLIQYVQNHPVVRRQDALTIFPAPQERGGAEKLYEQLGFRRRGFRWEFHQEE